MMARALLFVLLFAFLARAVSQLWRGVTQGMHGSSQRTSGPKRGIQMARDPVCGTFVVPERAITLSVGREQLYFCSPACRDAYRARTA
jgi:YHS domain-containing protein